MRVGVTGCAGFLGSHLVDQLVGRGNEVIGVDNLSMGRMDNLEQSLEHPLFRFYQADVRDGAAMDRLLAEVDVIVHLAAFKIPRYGNALDTLMINNIGTCHVLEAARKTGSKVVLASTSDVYGKSPDLPFREDGNLLLGPSTVTRWSYAVSKLYEEHLGLAYQESYGIPVVSLRFFGSYGPRHHLSWWGGPQSVFISQILRDEEITIHGDGQQTRSFTYVNDTVAGIVAATELEVANGEVFNIGSDHEISIVELARLIHRLCHTGRKLRFRFVPYDKLSGRKYEDVRRRIPDNSKASRLLGVSPGVCLEDGLLRTIEWQQPLVNGIPDEPQAVLTEEIGERT